ncbi:TonB-dependent receptor [Sphingomonas cannabina]|uniref:TonB-dependent receptor n=1 Tax=Sphingomonas cannabina TaxID=2899123 RepID=UPI001F1A5893|nr:TonB-dependent receptor [Sphingomonas cannabina]UIJ44674.1 TonB-dependent receptor [Sphingomonas cannabina]
MARRISSHSLAGASLGAMLLANLVSPAHAQTAPAEGETQAQVGDGPQPGDIIVTGFRSSLQRALDIKRESAGVVDSIVAEDIAKFPDNNLAESIQRVPGIAISRDQGQGRSISVRGLGGDFTSTRINGMESQATTDGYNGANRSRGFDFNVFASELFSQIDVRKTAAADLPEGSLGATVDLTTARPLSFRKTTVTLSAQGGYNDQAKKVDPRLAAVFATQTADGTLGFLVSGAYSRQSGNFQQSNSGDWNQGIGDGGFCNPVARPAACAGTNLAVYNQLQDPKVYNPRFPRYVQGVGRTERLGFTGSVQWKPSDRTNLVLDVLYSKFDVKRDDWALEPIGLSRAASQGGKPETIVRDGIIDSNNSLIYALLDNVDLRSEHNRDNFTTEFVQATLALEQKLGDRLTLKALAGHSRSDFDNFVDISTQIDSFNVDNFSYDLRPNGQNAPQIDWGIDVANPANWYFGPRVTQPGGTGATGPEIRLRPNYIQNRNTTARADLTFEAADDLKLMVGAEYKKYKFASQSLRYLLGEADWPAIPAGSSIQDLTEQFCGFEAFDMPAGNTKCWTTPNISAFADTYDIFSNTGRAQLSNTVSAARGDNRSVQEQDWSFYGMASFDSELLGMRVRGNLGGRFTITKQRSNFLTTVPVSVDPSGVVPTEVNRTYRNFLPSANLAFEPSDSLVVRLAAARTISRPPLGSLAGATTVNVSGGSRTVTTGNPYLKPFKSDNLDASIEWYPSRGSIVSIGAFYKKISTYIQSNTITAPYSTTGLPAELLAGTNVTPDTDFVITNVTNTPGGPLKGVELNLQQQFTFLPGLLSGFGVLANYTYVDSDIKYRAGAALVTATLLNLSKNSINGTLYYEKGGFQARGSVNYRDQYLTGVPAAFNQDVAGTRGATYVDASASYDITENLTISVDALNLTNQADVQYSDSVARRWVNYRLNGRQFYAGVRVKF